ncbi:MAG: hypothetical protein UT24_C0011G0023 [Candidatus Woesebacteria bacterium GW2011_GWB1_39_12]|uniref:Uncharacterized protein n=1 Tax=Candidatus Woesebacteria bacterium GW2011_GWB1_39_12 TaxID=1618574 RepID=A0A0G0PQY9_9BACT|nr:MAG: hypothetical protein UT24_C0011G0023 [Candidatus Woesebacteria bacterium GW2011_GWB1_39_12]
MNDYSPLTQREFLRTYYVAQGINIVGSCNDLFVLSLTTKQKVEMVPLTHGVDWLRLCRPEMDMLGQTPLFVSPSHWGFDTADKMEIWKCEIGRKPIRIFWCDRDGIKAMLAMRQIWLKCHPKQAEKWDNICKTWIRLWWYEMERRAEETEDE